MSLLFSRRKKEPESPSVDREIARALTRLPWTRSPAYDVFLWEYRVERFTICVQLSILDTRRWMTWFYLDGNRVDLTEKQAGNLLVRLRHQVNAELMATSRKVDEALGIEGIETEDDAS